MFSRLHLNRTYEDEQGEIILSCVRRCREGYEFFKSLRQRKVDLAASRALQGAAVT
jgi:hypothetical protein